MWISTSLDAVSVGMVDAMKTSNFACHDYGYV